LEDVIATAKPNPAKEKFRELEELLTEYEIIFSGDKEDYGRTGKVNHRIDNGDARPIRQPPRKRPLA
jgi:hypothetical protein